MMVENGIVAGLNEAQRRAVTAQEGPVLVLAGPGSGKTRVLTHRIAYLLSERGADPSEILAVTFTNKAAKEMRERLERLVGPVARALTVGTFHSVCARILRRDGAPVGLGPDFVIYDDDDQLRMLRQAILDIGLDDKQYTPRSMQSRISTAKNKLLTAEEYGAAPETYYDEVAARVYRRYAELMELNQAADFDDLLMKTAILWDSNPGVLARYRDLWRRVLVDEYQDTNHAQYTLIRLLTEEHRNLFVVGDEDQGIYSWRAADIQNILNFGRDFPDAQVILLEQNYRSTQSILDVATHVIQANSGRTPKVLWTEQAGGIPVSVREAWDENEEAQYIVRETQRLVASHGYRYGDIAVMYRTNAQSRSIEEAMVRYRLPHQLIGGQRFYERKEVKDALAYLRLIHNPYDTAAFRRVLENTPSGRGVGKGTLAAIEHFAAYAHLPLWDATVAVVRPGEHRLTVEPPRLAGKARTALAELVHVIETLRAELPNLPLPQLIDTTLNRTGYAAWLNDGTPEGIERWENVRELLSVAQEYVALEPKEALTTFLESVSLISDLDTMRSTGDTVTLITLHAAKGLEYKVVFIAGMEEGVLPHSRSMDNLRAIEEECRLAYVGVTRAMERLYLSYARTRTIFGATHNGEASRFLQAIPGSLLKGFMSSPRARRSSPLPAAQSLPTPAVTVRRVLGTDGTSGAPALVPPQTFERGDTVRHPKFGEGTVLSVEKSRNGDTTVEVRFAAGSTKKLLTSLSQMEKV